MSIYSCLKTQLKDVKLSANCRNADGPVAQMGNLFVGGQIEKEYMLTIFK